MRLDGKIAFVTGGGGGFGAGIAARFADEGARVAVADIDPAAAASVASRIGGLALTCDVADAASVTAAVHSALASHGRIDVLVNNAGTTHRNQPLLEVDEAEFDRVHAVNVKSIYLTARAVVPGMRVQGGGAIINIGSTAGLRPRPGLVWYNGTKGAVNTITQGMALELAADRIRVNAVCPVLGATGLTEQFIGGAATAETLARFVATIPLGRLSQPSDIANACVFLAEDASAFVTGVLLPVDGGRCA